MFDYNLDYDKINFREHPELYQIGIGEQGVLLVEPYKSEILPYWRFKTPEEAKKSAKTIYKMFLEYLKKDDFPGADMARKYLQMGFTRSRRYANHKSGKKYEIDGTLLPLDNDDIKAESAKIFYPFYEKAKNNKKYKKMKSGWINILQTI